MLGYDEGIKLGLSCGELIGTILVDPDGFTLGIVIGTYLVYSYVLFDGSNDGKLEVLLL